MYSYISYLSVGIVQTFELYLFSFCSISDSSSSQGLSQPSTQTTQYLRADTPNNATPVTSKSSFSNVLVLNCGGLAKRAFLHVIQHYIKAHKATVQFFFWTRS